MAPMVLAYWAFDTYWKFNVAKPDVFEPRDNKQSSNNGIIAISKTDCPP